MGMKNTVFGSSNRPWLNVYTRSDTSSEVVCMTYYNSEVEIDLDNSTDDFYKICAASGAEGYCQKEFITIK